MCFAENESLEKYLRKLDEITKQGFVDFSTDW